MFPGAGFFLRFRFTGHLDHVKPDVGQEKATAGGGITTGDTTSAACQDHFLLTRFCKEQTGLISLQSLAVSEQCLHSDLQNQQNNLLAWLRFLPPSRPTGNWKDPVLNVIHTDKRATGAQAWRATVTEQTQRSPCCPAAGTCDWDVLVQKGELKKICTRVTEEREMEWI